MFRLFLTLLIVLTSTTVQAQEVQYSDSRDNNSYTVIAPDNSVGFTILPYGGRAIDFYINGSWNLLSNNIMISDTNRQVYILDFALGNYTDATTNDLRPTYSIRQERSNEIELTATATIDGQRIAIYRSYLVENNGQLFETLTLSNTSSERGSLDFDGLAFSFVSFFDWANSSLSQNNVYEYQYFLNDEMQKARINGGSWFGSAQPLDFIQGLTWASLADNFFMSIVNPQFSNNVFVYQGLSYGNNARTVMGTQALAFTLEPNQSLSYQMEYYVGPRKESMVIGIHDSYKKLFAWPAIFNWFLKPIENGTDWFMTWLLGLTNSAGITLILIAILVKLVLLPLSIKSAISMKKMRILQPKLNKLQEKFGHDQQLLQQKTMELYQTEKANPLGGCLPLLLQIPVFFVLFRVLSRSVALRGSEFLWIENLTQPDTLFAMGSFQFHLLPIIMTLLQLVSVYLQQGRVGDTQNEMQKQMKTQGYMMPVIFLFLFWNMPSGLVLYWTVQNIFSILEQEVINLDSRIATLKK